LDTIVSQKYIYLSELFMTQEQNEIENSEEPSVEETTEQTGENDVFQDSEEQEYVETSVKWGNSWEDEISLLKERLARLQADYDNFKKRTERDREEMVFFINSKTFSRILPRIDDLERIVHNTPEELKTNTLFIWIEALYKAINRDIESLGVKIFISKWQKVDPERHDVMTQVPGEEWIIVDEFEKGYLLWDRVLRHAKVVVGSGN
jgi:molecular chaperone GrpE